jgi:hypothetical protein
MRATHAWHDSRITRCVLKAWLPVGLTILLPAVAAAQPWADAYKAGDYSKAAQLLQPIVVEQVQSMGQDGDPAPARHLAILFARGSGVDRDPVLACALARLSDMGAQAVPVRLRDAQDYAAYKETLNESSRFVQAHCDALTAREQRSAGQALGCLGFGLREGTLALGEQLVFVDRLGLRLAESDPDATASNLWCPQLVARLGTRTVAPPADAAPGVAARAFVEMLSWEAGQLAGDAGVRYLLTWKMFELRGKALEPVAFEPFLSVTTWPSPALPPDFEALLSIEMIRSGHIRWRLDGAPPKRGWIMLPEGGSR